MVVLSSHDVEGEAAPFCHIENNNKIQRVLNADVGCFHV